MLNQFFLDPACCSCKKVVILSELTGSGKWGHSKNSPILSNYNLSKTNNVISWSGVTIKPQITKKGGIAMYPFVNGVFFLSAFFEIASVYLWASHFCKFWWTNVPQMFIPHEFSYEKPCLSGELHPSTRSKFLEEIETKFTMFCGQAIQWNRNE